MGGSPEAPREGPAGPVPRAAGGVRACAASGDLRALIAQ